MPASTQHLQSLTCLPCAYPPNEPFPAWPFLGLCCPSAGPYLISGISSCESHWFKLSGLLGSPSPILIPPPRHHHLKFFDSLQYMKEKKQRKCLHSSLGYGSASTLALPPRPALSSGFPPGGDLKEDQGSPSQQPSIHSHQGCWKCLIPQASLGTSSCCTKCLKQQKLKPVSEHRKEESHCGWNY